MSKLETTVPDEPSEATNEQADAYEASAGTSKPLARRLLPLFVLFLLVALAFNAGTIRSMLRKPAAAPRGASLSTSARSLASPSETNKLLAMLGQKWDKPGPPVLLLSRPG